MQEIIKQLYLGSDDDVAKAKERGMSRLAACKDGIDSHRSMLEYESRGAPKGKEYLSAQRGNVMALNLIDADDPEMIPDAAIDAGLKFIKEQMDAGKTVFVHCNAGRSRSPSIVMMYLRSIGELSQSFVRSEHVFRTLYSDYDPSAGMRSHARARWKSLR
jgi:hypothetical protein